MKEKIFLFLKSVVIENKKWVFVLGAIACIPLITDNPYYLKTVTIFFIYSIFAMSWDLIGGYLGIVSFGHALFFGVAAYTTAILNVRLDWPAFINFPLSILCATLISLIVARPIIRLKGHYVALVTFAFPIIAINVLYAFPNFFGADLGISGLSYLSSSRKGDFYIAYFFVWGIFFFLRWLTMSDTGLVLRAIQSNEIAPINSGIDIVAVKLRMFVLSGMLAGIAGFLYAHVIRIVAPANLELHMSMEALVMCIIGGVGTLTGPILGAVIVLIVSEMLRFIEQYRILVWYILVLIIVLYFPKGLTGYINFLSKSLFHRPLSGRTKIARTKS
jgi:branched-chain amino acid transport system permease protein